METTSGATCRSIDGVDFNQILRAIHESEQRDKNIGLSGKNTYYFNGFELNPSMLPSESSFSLGEPVRLEISFFLKTLRIQAVALCLLNTTGISTITSRHIYPKIFKSKTQPLVEPISGGQDRQRILTLTGPTSRILNPWHS
jgi:hypothetical protein